MTSSHLVIIFRIAADRPPISLIDEFLKREQWLFKKIFNGFDVSTVGNALAGALLRVTSLRRLLAPENIARLVATVGTLLALTRE